MSDINSLPAGFGEADPDFMREAYAQSKKERVDGGDVMFLKNGITHVRVLPPHASAKAWFREYKEHGLRPSGKFQTYTCPASEGKPCPVCEYGKILYGQKTEESIKQAKQYYPKKAYLFNVYVYSSPDAKDLKNGIFVLKSGVKVFKQLMEFDNDPAGDWGDITSLSRGIDFRIERKGKGQFDTEYTCMPSPNRTNILEKLAAMSLEIGVPTDLSTVYPAKSYEDLKKALAESEAESESSE